MTLLLAGCGGGGSGGDQDPDPVVVDLPIAYVSRPLPTDEDTGDLLPDDALDMEAFNPGAQLILRDRASPSAPETIITEGVFADGELYDVKDVEPSFDGRRLVFSMRAPEDPNVGDDEQPTWNIWEYNLDDNSLRRLISSDIIAEDGQDVAPHYLADGRIVFSSSRQRQTRATLLDEGKPQYSGLVDSRNDDEEAFVLHVMEDDGTNISQITFNQSHDIHPTVLSTGQILFSRWDNIANRNSISIYRVNPDGSNLEFVYGFHSQDSGTNNSIVRFLQPRERPDGQILVSLRAEVSDSLGGDMVLLDTANFTENDQPTFNNAGAMGNGQASASVLEVSTDPNETSLHGHFNSVFPLDDGTNRILVSWSQCRLEDPMDMTILPCTDTNLANPALVEAPPLYGIWSYDLSGDSQLPIVTPTEGIMLSDIVAMTPRTPPAFIPDPVPGVDVDTDLVNENVGVLHIRSVYDFDGIADTNLSAAPDTLTLEQLADPLQATAGERPARYLRIVKGVPIPDDDVLDFDGLAFGVSTAQGMRDIIGYTPIQPDGSVKVKVPANIPFAISVLDANGRRVTPRHQNWLQLKPGEIKECSGCHTANSELPHGRPDAEAPSINVGAPATGIPFPNTEPALFADMGETMAETLTRINGIPDLTVDVEFTDVWTDPAVRAKDADSSFAYGDLTTAVPTTLNCLSSFNSNCRITINYEEHIQPIWEAIRTPVDDGTGNLIDTCVGCHNGNARVPAGQLELTSTPLNGIRFRSYQELFVFVNSTDNLNNNPGAAEQTENAVDEVVTRNRTCDVVNPDGSITTTTTPFFIAPTMRVAGANNSNQFLDCFEVGPAQCGSPRNTIGPTPANCVDDPEFPEDPIDHTGLLSEAELKLISEWLDIGAQYYNNPFDAPLN